MINLTFDELNNTQFTLYENNPVIKNPMNSFTVADPSLLTPDESHDGKWHLFCHTFFGIYHYVSDDGISFKKFGKVVPRAMRPNINRIGGRYYLFYERTKTVIENALCLVGAKWKSEIYVTESEDLSEWTAPKKVIGNTRPFERDERGLAISNPYLIENEGKFRLYYSCGQTFIKDCGFSEPTHISFAESDSITEGFVSREKPIISPDKSKKYINLCSGCIKVYRLKDCFIGLQNGIFEENGKSHSAIVLLKSYDGESFEYIKPLVEPKMCGDNPWMAQYVYASDMVYYEGKLRIYFNARNVANMLKGREAIGFAEGERFS